MPLLLNTPRFGAGDSEVVYSPYDLDASTAKKRSTYWIGYKAHVSEAREPNLPLLITQVTTTIGPTPDRQALPDIHSVLDQRQLLLVLRSSLVLP